MGDLLYKIYNMYAGIIHSYEDFLANALSSPDLIAPIYSIMPLHYKHPVVPDAIAAGAFPVLGDFFPRAITYCIILGLGRYLLTFFLFRPLALFAMDMKYPKHRDNVDIESYLFPKGKYSKTPAAENIEKFCKSRWRTVDVSANSKKLYTVEEVRAYVHQRAAFLGVDKKVSKFIEALWRLIFYSVFVGVGVYCLLWPVMPDYIRENNLWSGWPHTYANEAVKMYFQMEMGAYLHQLMWTEVSRSDSTEMIIHHVVTITLLFGSYFYNFTKMGSVIILIHDFSDIFLEAAKIASYVQKGRNLAWMASICDVLFAIFGISFFLARLVVYPRYCVYSYFTEYREMFGTEHTLFWVFGGLVLVLQCLHLFWFSIIAKMVYIMFATDQCTEDLRSDDEEVVDEAGNATSSRKANTRSTVGSDSKKQK